MIDSCSQQSTQQQKEAVFLERKTSNLSMLSQDTCVAV
jgi:hypothetical protein